MAAAAAPIFSADVSRPLATRFCSAASFIRTRSIDFMRCARSNAKRSSEWTTNTRTPSWSDGTSWTTLAGGDANRAFEPLSRRALNVVVDLTTTAAITADDVALTTRTQFIEVLGRDHAAITDKD